jgi:hypothetical protein
MTTHVSIDPQAMGCGSNPDTLFVHTKIAGVFVIPPILEHSKTDFSDPSQFEN